VLIGFKMRFRMSGGSGIAGAAQNISLFFDYAPAIVANHATATCQTLISFLGDCFGKLPACPKNKTPHFEST
jgi:hypothetical protein